MSGDLTQCAMSEALDLLDALQNDLMQKAVAELQKQYGWDERTAASVMLTVTTAVRLAPKPERGRHD